MTTFLMMLCHAVVVCMFGGFLAISFAGIPFTRKNTLFTLLFCICSLLAQGIVLHLWGETFVWKVYPLITHLPLVLLLMLRFKKPPITALVSVFASYLCCQPAKWFGLLADTLYPNPVLEYSVRIFVLIAVFAAATLFFTRTLSQFFAGDTKSVYVFAVVPLVYYVFDYATVVYADLWPTTSRVATEFLPFFISVMFIIFCFVYYKQYEEKFDAERKEEIVRLTVEQQAKELDAIKRSEHEIRVLRHDLRLFLSTLAVCIETDEKSVVQGMIHSYSEHVDGTKIMRFSANDTVNYVLSDFDAKCKAGEVRFSHKIEVGDLHTNEILFSSILSNALDNALHAVAGLPKEKRIVTLMLREANGRMLFSVKNPIEKVPEFVDGIPVSKRKGHGYGTQSIRYLTEKLGGNCQFTVKDSMFITRVIL